MLTSSVEGVAEDEVVSWDVKSPSQKMGIEEVTMTAVVVIEFA